MTNPLEAFARAVEQAHGVQMILHRRTPHDTLEHVELDLLRVPKEHRGMGLGTSAMLDLLHLADKNHIFLSLTPADKTFPGTSSRTRLVRFYKRFGFVENKGRHKDYTLRAGAMYRMPK